MIAYLNCMPRNNVNIWRQRQLHPLKNDYWENNPLMLQPIIWIIHKHMPNKAEKKCRAHFKMLWIILLSVVEISSLWHISLLGSMKVMAENDILSNLHANKGIFLYELWLFVISEKGQTIPNILLVKYVWNWNFTLWKYTMDFQIFQNSLFSQCLPNVWYVPPAYRSISYIYRIRY